MAKYTDGETLEYGKFKTLDGNRSVLQPRFKKVEASVNRVGFIPAPIIVNENWEIIDGQARFEVCKSKNLPIVYRQVEGIGQRECTAMNSASTNWTTRDYVDMYAALGNENFIRLQQLLDEYSDCGMKTVLQAASSIYGDWLSKKVKDGTLTIEESEIPQARFTLEYIRRFVPIIEEHQLPSKTNLKAALCFIYRHPTADKEWMFRKFEKHWMDCTGYSRIDQALECLSNIYNKSRRNGIEFFREDYLRFMNDSYSWYESKWGGRA